RFSRGDLRDQGRRPRDGPGEPRFPRQLGRVPRAQARRLSRPETRPMPPDATRTPSLPPLDCAAEAQRISRWMVEALATRLQRRGLVVALSGGVDSSVCAALAVRAVGAGKVYG